VAGVGAPIGGWVFGVGAGIGASVVGSVRIGAGVVGGVIIGAGVVVGVRIGAGVVGAVRTGAGVVGGAGLLVEREPVPVLWVAPEPVVVGGVRIGVGGIGAGVVGTFYYTNKRVFLVIVLQIVRYHCRHCCHAFFSAINYYQHRNSTGKWSRSWRTRYQCRMFGVPLCSIGSGKVEDDCFTHAHESENIKNLNWKKYLEMQKRTTNKNKN
jgi:hypothetical protein